MLIDLFWGFIRLGPVACKVYLSNVWWIYADGIKLFGAVMVFVMWGMVCVGGWVYDTKGKI